MHVKYRLLLLYLNVTLTVFWSVCKVAVIVFISYVTLIFVTDFRPIQQYQFAWNPFGENRFFLWGRKKSRQEDKKCDELTKQLIAIFQ